MREVEIGGKCTRIGKKRKVGKTEDNRPLGISRCGLKDNINMDLKIIGRKSGD
jgi:hypothetical protein